MSQLRRWLCAKADPASRDAGEASRLHAPGVGCELREAQRGMTAEEFRQIALGLPDAVAGAHQSHPDFRVNGKVFATLGYPDTRFGMVKLTVEQQAMVVAAEPQIFTPANGAWGRKGSTLVLLERLDDATAESALRMAFSNLSRAA